MVNVVCRHMAMSLSGALQLVATSLAACCGHVGMGQVSVYWLVTTGKCVKVSGCLIQGHVLLGGGVW